MVPLPPPRNKEESLSQIKLLEKRIAWKLGMLLAVTVTGAVSVGIGIGYLISKAFF